MRTDKENVKAYILSQIGREKNATLPRQSKRSAYQRQACTAM